MNIRDHLEIIASTFVFESTPEENNAKLAHELSVRLESDEKNRNYDVRCYIIDSNSAFLSFDIIYKLPFKEKWKLINFTIAPIY